MPRPNLWHFTLAGRSPAEGVYICLGSQVLTKYGCVKDIRINPKDGEGCIKVSNHIIVASNSDVGLGVAGKVPRPAPCTTASIPKSVELLIL